MRNMFKVDNKGNTTTTLTSSLLLSLNMFHTFFQCFCCGLWAYTCLLGCLLLWIVQRIKTFSSSAFYTNSSWEQFQFWTKSKDNEKKYSTAKNLLIFRSIIFTKTAQFQNFDHIETSQLISKWIYWLLYEDFWNQMSPIKINTRRV